MRTWMAIVLLALCAPLHADEAKGKMKTPREYLAGAVSGTIQEMKTEGGKTSLVTTKTLDEAGVKEKLRDIDLDHVQEGTLPRCLPTKSYKLNNKSGQLLGSIGFCGNLPVRFDSADGHSGTIGPKK